MMAKKRNILNMGKRGLAFFLTLVMTLSMLQLQVFAAGYTDQIMDGWYLLNEDGTVAGTTTEETYSDHGFTLSKSIVQTDENEFDITLKVVTSETVTTDSAAVMLVIDNSSSMEQCADCGAENCRTHTDTRLEAIQKILTEDGGFMDGLAAGNTGNVYVSVVSFDASADKECEWLDIKQADNLETVKNSISKLTNGSGTNIHGGLMLGRNRLAMDEVKNVSAKYLVLLSDGEPYHSSRESTSVEKISGSYGYDNAGTARNMAEQIRSSGTVVYSVGYGYSDDLLEDISGSEDRTFSGNSSAEISAAFANIAQSATEGMSGSGSTVTDPMGAYIVLGDVEDLSEDGLTASGGTITWELDPDNAVKTVRDNVTTYTYKITYPITLDTAAQGFREDVYYPTNDYTYLTIPADEGRVKIPFNVPGVCGQLPEVEWEIEYYLQEDAAAGDYDNYMLDDSAQYGPVDVWTTVNAPEGYADKYTAEYYTFVDGEVQMQVTPTGENVMRLYYDYITAPVTVNHYYKTDTILPTGEEVFGAYPATPDKTSISYVRVNTDFQAVPETVFGGFQYELELVEPELEIMVALGADNVIDLYYTRLDDQRVITSTRVDHVYNDYTYELNDGKYELVQIGSITETAEQATAVRATTIFNVSPNPLGGYESYELNKELGDYDELLQGDGTLSFVVAEDPEDNVRTLVFERVTDPRQEIKVTVNHYYTKSVTTVEDGQVVTTVDPDNELGESEEFTAYVGEAFTAVEINHYMGDDYVSDPSNASKLHIDALTDSVEIELYYELVETPVPVDIIVNHYWRTFTEVTVEETEDVVDPETGDVTTVVTGTRVEIREELDHSVEDITVSGLYEQQEYTAPKMSWGEGYTFNDEESNPTIIVGDEWVIDMYYDLWDSDDERSDADIDVIHNYVTYLSTIVDGQPDVLTINDGSVQEKFDGMKAGDTFTAASAPEFNGNEYNQVTDDADLSVILQPGTNATIVIDYIREASDLVDTDYIVNYEYHTYNMTVDANGVAGYWEAPIVETGEPVSGTGYVGQKVSLDSGDRAGFTPLAANPAVAQTLADSGNEWTFVHEQYNALDKGTVTVNHYYRTTTIAINGTSTTSDSSVLGAPVEKYLGETVLAEYVPNGFELVDSRVDGVSDDAPRAEIVVTVTGDTIVDFYYEKVIDNSILADYSIAHIYELYTWDGELISVNAPDPATGTGYVTTIITAAPEPNDYTLVESTYNGDPLDEPYTIALRDGTNEIVFVYEKYLPRELLDVKVIHNYYQNEEDVGVAAPLSVFEHTATDVPEDSDYTADMRVTDGYAFYSADPADCTITVLKGVDNVIILNYVRQTAQYMIVHEYYCNDDLESVTTGDAITGYVGDEVKGDSIPRVPSCDGNTYQFIDISDDIVLEAGEIKTITLRYQRTVYIPPAEPGISITKLASDQVVLDDSFSYLIEVESTGNADATNVIVTDVLPQGVAFEAVEFIGESFGGTVSYDDVTRTVTAVIGVLPAGEMAELEINVRAQAVGTVVNTAVVTADKALEDKDDATTVIGELPPPPVPAISVEKSSSVSSAKVGEKFSYTITVKSTGTAAAENVVLTDNLPEGVELADGSGKRELSWDLGDMAPGTEQSVTIEVIATKVGTVKNVAVVTTDEGDIPAEDEVVTDITSPGLYVKKTSSVSSAKVGEKFSYTITVKSTGTAAAENVVLTDNLPEGVELADGSGKRELSWDLGDMAPGAERSVTIEVVATKAGTVKNVAVAAADDTAAEDEVVTEISELPPPPVPAVTVEKTSSVSSAKVGEKFSYTITVKSIGNTDAENVVVTDNLPEGVELADGSGKRELSWDLGDMAPGAEQSVTIEVIATKAGTVKNVAVAAADDTTDEDEVVTEISEQEFELVIRKKLDGNRGDRHSDKVFTFNVKGENVDENITITGEGERTIKLVKGSYTVTESDGYEQNYYRGTTVNGESGREIEIDLNADGMEIEFVNIYRRSSSPDPEPEDPTPNPEPIPDPVPDPEPASGSIEIPDEDVPLAELPDEQIPLAEVPKTGEEMMYRIMAAVSGVGLAALAVTGRKRKEEEMA